MKEKPRIAYCRLIVHTKAGLISSVDWKVPECPYCGKQHVHGAGVPGGELLIGHRLAHCVIKDEGNSGYYLIPAKEEVWKILLRFGVLFGKDTADNYERAKDLFDEHWWVSEHIIAYVEGHENARAWKEEVSRRMSPGELKVWRKHNGYTQADLAWHLGVPTARVSMWERGKDELLIPAYVSLIRYERA